MATWPSGNKPVATTTDADSDSISGARVDLNKTVANQIEIIDMFNIPASPTDNYILVYNASQNRFGRKESYGCCPINHNPMKLEQTQDLPLYYMENSYLYTFLPKVLEYNNRIGYNPYIMEIGFPYNLDIDTEEDWKVVNVI